MIQVDPMRLMPGRSALLCVIIWLIAMTSAKGADAVTFTPASCSLCPTYTSQPWVYDSLAEIAQDPNHAGNYINNLGHVRSFVANGFVKDVRFHFQTFSTEYGHDFFSFQQDLGEPESISGSFSSTNIAPIIYARPQLKPVQLGFSADRSLSYPGFVLDSIEVCCESSFVSLPNFDMAPGRRYSGYLQGPNDVVYLRIPSGPVGTRLRVALWGNGTSGQDFDLYARCGQLPTPNFFDWRSFSGDSDEFMASAPDECTGQSWYIAVSDYSGIGQFSIVASYAKSVAGSIPIRVGIDQNVSLADRFQVATTMTQALRFVYGLTEGQVAFAPCDVWNNTGTGCTNCSGSPCDVCFEYNPNGTTPASAGLCPDPASGTHVNIPLSSGYWTSPRGVAHELAHQYLCTQDEYDPLGCNATAGLCNWHCGHSVMANPFSGQNNFCFKSSGIPTAHERDPSPGWVPQNTMSAWDSAYLSGRVVWSPTDTPDNFSYVNHDFDDKILCNIR